MKKILKNVKRVFEGGKMNKVNKKFFNHTKEEQNNFLLKCIKFLRVKK